MYLHDSPTPEAVELAVDTCPDPFCDCGAFTLRLTTRRWGSPLVVQLDIRTMAVDDTGMSLLSTEQQDLVDRVVERLKGTDRHLLLQVFHDDKAAQIASPAIDDAVTSFQFDRIQTAGDFVQFRSILRFAPAHMFGLGSQRYAVEDAYCVCVGCACTRAILHIYPVDKACKRQDLGMRTFLVNFGIGQWSDGSGQPPAGKAAALVRALRGSKPNIESFFAQRQKKLAGIFKNSIERHRPDLLNLKSKSEPPARKTKVGRNAPCPCGSGNKSKRCCMH